MQYHSVLLDVPEAVGAADRLRQPVPVLDMAPKVADARVENVAE